MDLHHVFWECPAAHDLRDILLHPWLPGAIRPEEIEFAVFSLTLPRVPTPLWALAEDIEEDDEAVDVDSDDDNEGVSGTSSEEDAAATNLGADVISNDSDADECDTEADQPRAAQTIVV
ncbi:hypothetical protein PInf_007974 [Phytophthora infestans]|nr:hypothetical protein PInf_007974 [Phytophthora infestans]